MTAPNNSRHVEYNINGSVVPLRTVQQCRTCSHPMRAQLERLICSGRTYKAILREHPNTGLNERNLADHYNSGHTPVQSAAVQQAARSHADDLAMAAAPIVETLAGQLRLHRAVAKRVAERLDAGEVEPSVAEGLAAERLLMEVEAAAGTTVDVEMWRNATVAVMEVASSMIPPERRDEFRRQVESRPDFDRALWGRAPA